MFNFWNGRRLTVSLASFAWVGTLAFSGLLAHARDSNSHPPPPTPLLSADALADEIDALIAVRQKKQHVQPAPSTDDAEFIRRVYLDLAGCIPSIVDTRDFFDDPRPNKRAIWIQELLNGQKPSGKPDAYGRHFASVWRSWLLARLNDQQVRANAPSLEAWLYHRLRDNARYDDMVRELLGAQPGGDRRLRNGNESASAAGFVQANENRPENLAGSTARLFLGVQLDCSRCHNDRSGGSWTQKQFWSYAACFVEGVAPGKLQIEGKDKTVSACFPDGSKPAPQTDANSSRQQLVQWLTAPDNPYFARAAANRLWSYFFGIGLTEPVDAGGDHNPPSHPELLDRLAQQFACHQFDLRYLIEAITHSRAYQRSSVPATPGSADPRLFSRMAVRGLSAEQLFDSLAEATEFRDSSSYRFGGNSAFDFSESSVRGDFLHRFIDQAQRTEAQTSILQALYLMNSNFVADRTSLESNPTLATIADMADRGTLRQVESLFLVVLSRKPRSDEFQRLKEFVESGNSNKKRQALADVFWVLLNSAEFRQNH